MSVAQLLQADQARGLISPPQVGCPSLPGPAPTRTDEILMILNQGAFFKDTRPTETYQQAADFLEQKEQPASCLQEAENQYTSSDVDPNIYTQLEAEAVRSGSNVFSHTSQDFVAQVISGIKRYQKEARLYTGDVTFTARGPAVSGAAERDSVQRDETIQQTAKQNKKGIVFTPENVERAREFVTTGSRAFRSGRV